jgi:hypothetical protein
MAQGQGRGDRLTLKELKFCHSYIKYNNASKAAIEAGFSKSYANNSTYKIMQRGPVKAYIEGKMIEITRKAVQEIGVDVKWRLSKLKKGVDLGIDDNATSAKECDINAGRACIAEMNKMDGAYAPVKEEQEVTLNEGANIETVEKYIEEHKKDY